MNLVCFHLYEVPRIVKFKDKVEFIGGYRKRERVFVGDDEVFGRDSII